MYIFTSVLCSANHSCLHLFLCLEFKIRSALKCVLRWEQMSCIWDTTTTSKVKMQNDQETETWLFMTGRCWKLQREAKGHVNPPQEIFDIFHYFDSKVMWNSEAFLRLINNLRIEEEVPQHLPVHHCITSILRSCLNRSRWREQRSAVGWQSLLSECLRNVLYHPDRWRLSSWKTQPMKPNTAPFYILFLLINQDLETWQ